MLASPSTLRKAVIATSPNCRPESANLLDSSVPRPLAGVADLAQVLDDRVEQEISVPQQIASSLAATSPAIGPDRKLDVKQVFGRQGNPDPRTARAK